MLLAIFSVALAAGWQGRLFPALSYLLSGNVYYNRSLRKLFVKRFRSNITTLKSHMQLFRQKRISNAGAEELLKDALMHFDGHQLAPVGLGVERAICHGSWPRG